MRTPYRFTVSLLLLVALATLSAAAEPGDEVVVEIGDDVITVEEFWAQVDALPPQYQTMVNSEEGRQAFLDQLIQERVLFQAALEEDYEDDPEIAEEIERMRIRTLATFFFQRQVGENYGFSREELREYYEENPEYFLTDAQVRMRHLLVETEREARDARERLAADEVSFADLAKEISLDPKTRRLGGMVGLVTQDMPIPQLGSVEALQEVIFELPVGEVSEPIESEMGWHLVLIEEQIEPKPLEFERIIGRVADQMLVPEEQALDYYQEHQEEFLSDPQVQARIIVCFSEEDAEAAHKSLEAGEEPREVAREYNEDERTKADEGLLGFVKRTSPVPALGRQAREVLSVAFDELEDGGYSEPIEIDEAWVVIVREAFRDSGVRPYPEVRGTIRGRLISEEQQLRVDKFFEELRERFDVEVDQEVLMTERPPSETPEELYALAEVAPPPTAIEHYQDILDFYPDSPEAPKAQFMIGFLYSDRLKNYDEAEAAFNAYLENWPEGEFADDARYMLEHMRDEDPLIEEDTADSDETAEE